MSRSYQHIRLKPEAHEWIIDNVRIITDRVCPRCQYIIISRKDSKTYEDVDSFFDDGPHLQEYILKDGSSVKEVVQLMPWSSGPMGFLCLEKDGKRMFEWTGKEVNKVESELVENADRPIYEQ